MTDQRFISYAQNLEDVLLWRALSQAIGSPTANSTTPTTTGFYVDIGASDPTALSVTRAFYDRGWRGLNVEPLPEQADRLRQARPRDIVVQAAVGARPASAAGTAQPAQRAIPFYRVIKDQQTGLSTTDADEADHHRAQGAEVETLDVPVTTLADLCREHVHGPVHFLKIDVEGAEAAVLAGADFTGFRPWIILIEATQPLDAAAADLMWEPPLLAAAYDFVWFDGLNRFYLAREHADLARHFRVPPNVFDHYVVYDTPLNDHLAETIALSERRRGALEALEAEMANLQRRLAKDPPPPEPALPEPAATAAAPTKIEPPVASPPAQDSASSIDLPFTRTTLGRRLGLRLYRFVRPVARPMAWRSRQFMTGDLRQEIADLRIRLDQLVARPVHPPATHADAAMMAAMERLLLTLALEDARDPSPPGLDPAPCSGLSKTGTAR